MPARSRDWRHSAGLRFGLIYAVLLGLGAVATAAVLWFAAATTLRHQIDDAILADSADMRAVFDKFGPKALIDHIQDRIDNDIEDDSLYVLMAPDNRRFIGTLDHLPAGVPAADEAEFETTVPHYGANMTYRVHKMALPGGAHLLIGRDVRLSAHLAHVLTKAVPWAALLMLVLGTVGATAVRMLFVSMLAHVSETANAISAGDLTRRVPIRGRGDEFDELPETINHMLDRISRLMDGVREVSNAIAHDLRTPIARARARLEEALRERSPGGAGEPALRAAIERAIADLDGIVGIFQALLRIAEIESGARRSAFAPFDAVPLLRDLAELYEAAAEDRGQRLVLSVPERLTLLGDRAMLQQAIANLLDNALKFSPPDSTVRLMAAAPAGKSVTITVSDEGAGIPEGDRARATERFFRGEAARHAPGSGLGLSVVQAVATLHGGTLALADNRPGLAAVLSLPALAETRMERVSLPAQRAATPRLA